MTEPFWRRKTLAEMTHEEWESLCDGCGLCCMHKLEDEDTGEVWMTCVSCRLLDPDTGRCTDYANRHALVPECLRLTPETVPTMRWLPGTCAYRRVAEGRDLPEWHPLVCGDPDRVVTVGISVAGRALPETEVDPEDYEALVVARLPDLAPGD